MTIKIVTFEEQYFEEAARLVQARYKALRQQLPMLPERYEQEEALLELMGELGEERRGVAALRDGKLVGFLAGLTIHKFMGKRSAYSPIWANGVVQEESQRIYEEMYTHLADQWVADGCDLHLLSLLADDAKGLQSWQWLGFGLINVDAVRGLDAVEGLASPVEMRQACTKDIRTLSRLGKALETHLATSPTFFIHSLGDFGERLETAGEAVWLAEADGETAGFITMEPGNCCECEFLKDERTINIAGTFTEDSWRGRGVATALLNQGLAWAKQEGYERCTVDFETGNPLARRFWSHWFQPVGYSLMRWVDERL